ncbi:hypothetical protein [Clostridium botulinum]|uniref:hypothetical protein n=1 Tax=Clostridium botulinum TaxID=1491 RepID=UPI003DA6CCA4
MSKKSDELENKIVQAISVGTKLPDKLPSWMTSLGIKEGAKIISVEGIGSKDRRNKTDVIIRLENSKHIKVSAKLSNADYFGNWYGHQRFLQEFGEDAFNRLTVDATNWANEWTGMTEKPFVGVSICFGRRSGRTGKRFLDIFTNEDILSVARGYGEGDHIANCLYVSSKAPANIEELLHNLQPINLDIIKELIGEFKIVYRPIDPRTEGTNRGKNVYTQFVPYKKLDKPTIIESTKDLFQLGKFQTVKPTRLNHNHILNTLEKEYNIIVPRKNR